MKKLIAIAGGFAALCAIGAGQAVADQSGLAGMHAQYVFKGRVCFSDHTHVGTGSPSRSKRAAIASAAGDWSSFTAFEYGSSWASWRAAIAKKISCNPSSDEKWACEVEARPCLTGPRVRHRQARR